VGQVVRVKVLSADPKAKRIALSIKALETPDEPKRKLEQKAKEPPKPVEDRLSQLASRFRTR